MGITKQARTTRKFRMSIPDGGMRTYLPGDIAEGRAADVAVEAGCGVMIADPTPVEIADAAEEHAVALEEKAAAARLEADMLKAAAKEYIKAAKTAAKKAPALPTGV